MIGEGGCGGALGIGVGDRVLMLEYAYYSVISPEGCAAILWKDGERAPEAAEALRLTTEDLLRLKVIDEVVPEPLGGAHRAPTLAMDEVKRTILKGAGGPGDPPGGGAGPRAPAQVPPHRRAPRALPRRRGRLRGAANTLGCGA